MTSIVTPNQPAYWRMKRQTAGVAIRPIVKAAFKVRELVHQFEDIDVPDQKLESGSIDEVNEKYDDAHLIGEAENRLDIAMDEYNQEEECWRKDAAQLRRFLKKWRAA
jgi:hypothetical protein